MVMNTRRVDSQPNQRLWTPSPLHVLSGPTAIEVASLCGDGTPNATPLPEFHHRQGTSVEEHTGADVYPLSEPGGLLYPRCRPVEGQ
jgi:hypothetical protein